MEGFLNRIIIVCLSIIPITCDCKTVAYSPSIPGQPLIFHTTTPSSFENEIADKLCPKNRYLFFRLSKLSSRLSEEFLSLVGNAFLPLVQAQSVNVTTLYNRSIDESIDQIHKIFSSLKGSSSKKLSKLVKETLINLKDVTNLLVVNPIDFQEGYSEMQQQVINFYTDGLEDILSSSSQNSVLEADAVSALEGLVSCLGLVILDTESLVNDSISGQKDLVFARQQTNINLAIFLEATFGLQAGKKKCEYYD